MFEAIGIAGVLLTLGHTQLVRVRVESFAVRPDVLDRNDSTDSVGSEVPAILAMTLGAVLPVDRLALVGQFLIQPKWIRGRFVRLQPLACAGQ